MSVSLHDLKAMMYELTDIWVLLEKYLDEVRRLQQREESIIVSGFDDTLFSRKDMIKGEELLHQCDNDEEINKISMYHIGIPHILEHYYVWKSYPQDIVSKMDPKKDFILTFGFEHVQKQKLAALWLSDFPVRVSAHKSEKVLNFIQHILYEIKYLPSEIIVYDNDPEDFITYRELIEAILQCKLVVMEVQMDGNSGYEKIEELKTEA